MRISSLLASCSLKFMALYCFCCCYCCCCCYCFCWELFAAVAAELSAPVLIFQKNVHLLRQVGQSQESCQMHSFNSEYISLTNFHINFRSLFFSQCGFMKSIKSSNWLRSLQFLKTNSLLASSLRVFQSLKISLFFLLFRVSRVGRCWFAFLRV